MKIINDICEKLDHDTLNSPGAVFYSNYTTLQKGKFIIIGLNPGGDPNIIKTTIGDSLKSKNLYNQKYNEYYESWLPNGQEHRLQKNLKSLFCYLGKDLKTICATNLVFERTVNEKTISMVQIRKYREIVDLILKNVKPEVVVVFGKRSLSEIKLYYQIENENVNHIVSGHGNWHIQLIKSNNIKIIGLPHLSRYVLYSRKEILEQIKNFIKNNSCLKTYCHS